MYINLRKGKNGFCPWLTHLNTVLKDLLLSSYYWIIVQNQMYTSSDLIHSSTSWGQTIPICHLWTCKRNLRKISVNPTTESRMHPNFQCLANHYTKLTSLFQLSELLNWILQDVHVLNLKVEEKHLYNAAHDTIPKPPQPHLFYKVFWYRGVTEQTVKSLA